jgi:hypothetical protein
MAGNIPTLQTTALTNKIHWMQLLKKGLLVLVCCDADTERKHFQHLATSVLRDFVMLFGLILQIMLKEELKKPF